eukprot:5150626-Prymnesium_polylepis.1
MSRANANQSCRSDGVAMARFAVTGCQKSGDVRWAERLAAAVPQAAPVLVNVGANKGFNAAAFLDLWSPQLGVNEAKWHQHIVQYAAQKSIPGLGASACGMCNRHCP